jgi:hypothetical protein
VPCVSVCVCVCVCVCVLTSVCKFRDVNDLASERVDNAPADMTLRGRDDGVPFDVRTRQTDHIQPPQIGQRVFRYRVG